jgi:hypothetical protein
MLVKKQMLQLGSVAFFASFAMGIGMPRCDEEQLCNAAAELSAKTELRCGSSRSFEEAAKAFKEKVAFGDCRTIKSIRDRDSLVNQCLPWLENASCDLLNQGQILPACLNQFSTSSK